MRSDPTIRTTKTSTRPVANAGQERGFIASLANGMAVLEALAAGGTTTPLASITRSVGRSKPTTWRLVHTLVKLGYVRQDPLKREFALTPRVLALGASFDGVDLKDLAGEFLRRLSAQIGETANMAVLDGDRLIYIERVKTSQLVNINLQVGSRLPLYNTSMGRVLLAFMPEAELRQCLVRLTADPEAKKYTRSGCARLLDLLAETRRRGYALNDEELVLGLRSVAAPVWDSTGRAIAAINIAVPSVRVSLRQLRVRHVPALLATAHEISAALGYQQARGSLREVVNERRRRIS
jgi:IclR family pca regulon transcriptional regulator